MLEVVAASGKEPRRRNEKLRVIRYAGTAPLKTATESAKTIRGVMISGPKASSSSLRTAASEKPARKRHKPCAEKKRFRNN